MAVILFIDISADTTTPYDKPLLLQKIEFSGTHYFGYTTTKPHTNSKYDATSSGFELRRNYLQVRGYFNEKDYWRLTLDATKELASDVGDDSKTKGYAGVFVKYAYLYLDEILPYTSVEFGIAHRPWIDYEEHNSWFYRSFNKVAIEEKATPTESGVDLVNSADLGVNFKTKTENFSSEIGIFNGEGYHSDKGGANQKNDKKLSFEWRLTSHLIGSGLDVGKMKRKEQRYAHISTFGLISNNHKDDSSAINQTSPIPLKGEYNRQFYGIHTVYNQPEFLIGAQYIIAQDKARDSSIDSNWLKRDYELLSINAEYRIDKDWNLVGRYDRYNWDDKTVNNIKSSIDGEKYIAALAYQYNKHISFIGSAKLIDEKFTANQTKTDSGESKDLYMFTTEIKW